MFQAGQSGNPGGRPKGSYGGRVKALATLDRLLAKKKNQDALLKALEADFEADPVRFFKSVIMPLLPRESRLEVDRQGVIQWKSLLGAREDAEHGERGSERLAVNSEQRGEGAR